tara:strand:- start:458 stop:1117 length:660 start_codon:yes stop_codon:yes gene_type:complete
MNKKYLRHAKKLKTLVIRGLPINNKKLYFEQELSIDSYIGDLRKINSNLNFKKIIQVPNPKNLKFKEFEKFLNENKKQYYGFELIGTWHNMSFLDKAYSPYFEYFNTNGLLVSLDLDYFFRTNTYTVLNFLKLLKKYPNINFILPHFGCGIFLHWNKVLDLTNKVPKLLSSSPQSIYWLEIFKLKKFKKIPIFFSSDHPLNGNQSIQMYDQFITYKKKI